MRKNKFLKLFGCIFSVTLCFVLLASLFSPSAVALEENRTILAIGDSISTGYGLDDPETQCFVYGLLGEGGKVINMAINGNTASGILSQIKDKNHEKKITVEHIKEADIVTITCGGNDMMAVLYSSIADEWNKNHQDDKIDGTQVLEKLAEMDFGMLLTVVNLFNPESESYVINSKTFEDALSEYAKNLKEITEYINSVNPSVAVIVSTQYNPYAEFKGTKLDIVYKGFEEGVSRLNKIINDNSFEGGYIVSDSKKLFDDREGLGDYYNADEKTVNLDFHPTAEGHELLAESFTNTISQLEYVEITVSSFFEGLDGAFSNEGVENLKYDVVRGKKVFATAKAVMGFTFDKDAEGTVLSAVADEGVILKMYYTRNTYKLGWHTYEDILFEEYKFGQPITAPKVKRKGYNFMSWDEQVPETMPAADITFVALWGKKKMNPLVVVIVLLLIASASISMWAYSKDKKKRS